LHPSIETKSSCLIQFVFFELVRAVTVKFRKSFEIDIFEFESHFDAIIGAANAAYNNPELGWVGSLVNLKRGDGYWVIVNDNFVFHWLNED